MNLFDDELHKSALVIGAGSGRDMASAVLVTEKLRELRIGVDLGGFLTPWALHTFDGNLEKPVNALAGPNTRKFLASKKDSPLDSYFEPGLVTLNAEWGLGIGRFYLFSLQYGTEVVRQELDSLIHKNGYDVVIAVDVGGDILARKQDYPWLLTPIVDLSCLSILAGLESPVDSYLTVVAPGVDGEIPCQNLVEIFDELHGKELVSGSEELGPSMVSYQTFERVSKRISERTTSKSNTSRLIQNVISSSDEALAAMLEKRVSLMGREWRFSFPVTLKPSLAKGIFHFDLKEVHAWSAFEMSYGNILEAFATMKQLGAGGTEVDLSFVPLSIRQGDYEETVLLLTPPERLDSGTRKEILAYGLKLMEGGAIPCSMMLKKDMDALDLPPNLDMHEAGSGLYALSLRGR